MTVFVFEIHDENGVGHPVQGRAETPEAAAMWAGAMAAATKRPVEIVRIEPCPAGSFADQISQVRPFCDVRPPIEKPWPELDQAARRVRRHAWICRALMALAIAVAVALVVIVLRAAA